MHVTTLSLLNIRSFAGKQDFDCSRSINLIVGKNNSGKSTVLRSLRLFQAGDDGAVLNSMMRSGTTDCRIYLTFKGTDDRLKRVFNLPTFDHLVPDFTLTLTRSPDRECSMALNSTRLGQTITANQFNPIAPDNLFYFYFAGKKTAAYDPAITLEKTRRVSEKLEFLVAHVQKLSNPDHPSHKEFVAACESILGRRVGVVQTKKGQEVGLWLSEEDSIPITAMGEGVSNVLGLLVSLCVADGNIFLLEEVENDLHPTALKQLLEVIVRKSEKNQFFISTHSNIVVRHLGSIQGTRVFNLTLEYSGPMPLTRATRLDETESARQDLLRDLGYEPFDFGLWQGYLILEESSAESIINRILIPNFVPGLSGRLRTISASGASNVEACYADFHRLFVFTHTSEIYHKHAWVRVDGDEAGAKVLGELRTKFSQASDRFAAFHAPNFESYLPLRFAGEVAALPTEKSQRRKAKAELCRRVLAWADKEPELARDEFATSASEIVDDLRRIESALKAAPQG